MKTRKEIINLYLADLNNVVNQSPARDSRIEMLKNELREEDGETCPYTGNDYPDCELWQSYTNGCGDCIKYKP